VTSFGNGREAHERLQQEPFTLLLTDIVMPQMDGIELARRASEIDPELKIMFITGFAAVTLNTSSQAVKDAQVLSKPFHLKDLVREIDRLLGIAT
jgi:two-component system cell cycle response regulator CpdR